MVGKLLLLPLLAGAALVAGCANLRSDWPGNRNAIVGVLTEQAAAWNRGDVDAFMLGYWNSPELSFSSGGETRRGWQATYERYKSRYPTRAEMGTLEFSELEARPIGTNAALVLGRWKLERDHGPIGGNFTLLFQLISGKWVIVHDHTSLSESH